MREKGKRKRGEREEVESSFLCKKGCDDISVPLRAPRAKEIFGSARPRVKLT